MKLSFILFAVLAAVSWAKNLLTFYPAPLQQAGAEGIWQGSGAERRAPMAQTIPPEKLDRCDKCDAVYFNCIHHSDFCRHQSSYECQLYCRTEACDYQDCYKNCGWTDCSHKEALQIDNQQDGAQQEEAQQEPTVEERSPVAQHPDKPPNNPCENCDKKFESCMNDWWCWFHKDVCFKDCRIEVCEEIEECHQKCGYKDCEVRKQSAAFQANHGKNTTQHTPNEETTAKQGTDGNTGIQQELDADPNN